MEFSSIFTYSTHWEVVDETSLKTHEWEVRVIP